MNRSRQLFRKAESLLVGGVNSPVRAFRAVGGRPLFIARARGATVWDADGRPYVDYLGSWGPMILGHAVPEVIRAAGNALKNGSSYGAPAEVEVRAAAMVREAFPSMERVRFVSSGTEACMSALRLARGYTGRRYIVKFAGCYHGHSDGLLVSAGSGAATFGHPTSAGVPPEVARLTIVLPYNDESAVESAFRKWGKEIACVIVEPVSGNMGVVAPEMSFLCALRRLTKKHGALLIFDEVITGFRLSLGGAQALFGLRPDLTCLGKIVGGGFPVGAFGGPRRIMEKLAPLGPVYQAGTLSGNPVAMAAGCAVLAELKKARPYGRLREKTRTLAEGIRESGRRRGQKIVVNSMESLFTVFFTDRPVTDFASALRCDTRRYARFFHGLLKRGVYFPPAQFEAAFVSAAHQGKDIRKTLAAVDDVFREMK
ncbi:MAG: glutamate-1-semialdehyde 2,1-aminomutase [Elusimicrobia bacterium]|nr:glutamate-1-semialdehyde 2,1-aminomutase [Elusimicrobiota bacterium]